MSRPGFCRRLQGRMSRRCKSHHNAVAESEQTLDNQQGGLASNGRSSSESPLQVRVNLR